MVLAKRTSVQIDTDPLQEATNIDHPADRDRIDRIIIAIDPDAIVPGSR